MPSKMTNAALVLSLQMCEPQTEQTLLAVVSCMFMLLRERAISPFYDSPL